MTNIAFIEDDPIFLKSLLETVHFTPWLHCVHAVQSMEAFWALEDRSQEIDLIFLDLGLPGQSGLAGLPTLRKQYPNTQIIVLTQFETPDTLFRALYSGADGYLLKDFQLFKLPEMVKIWENGGALISPMMARFIVKQFQPSLPAASALNQREEQLLQLFSDGYSYEEASKLMGISINGVRYFVKRIYLKLRVRNKQEAILAYNKASKNG
ncbi:response regulator transcription factor [Runella sp.]|uniref:response regulator transcription factor n=1 Tax=Runella sp. TaxID=1960881 RepID=UPI003015DCDD